MDDMDDVDRMDEESGLLRLEPPWYFEALEDIAGRYLRQYDPMDKYKDQL